MKRKTLITFLLSFGFLFLFNFGVVGIEAEASTNGIDLNKVKSTQENVSIDSLFVIAKEYSIPIVLAGIIISGFMAVAGLVFKPLKMAAGGLFGTVILFFILVNYAPEIAGVLISVVDGVMTRVTGGA